MIQNILTFPDRWPGEQLTNTSCPLIYLVETGRGILLIDFSNFLKAIWSSLMSTFRVRFWDEFYAQNLWKPVPSASRASYADIVKRKSPLKDDLWRRFQAEDEDEAIEKVGFFSSAWVIYFRN